MLGVYKVYMWCIYTITGIAYIHRCTYLKIRRLMTHVCRAVSAVGTTSPPLPSSMGVREEEREEEDREEEEAVRRSCHKLHLVRVLGSRR